MQHTHTKPIVIVTNETDQRKCKNERQSQRERERKRVKEFCNKFVMATTTTTTLRIATAAVIEMMILQYLCVVPKMAFVNAIPCTTHII